MNNELDKLFDALAQTTSETALRDAYKMFEAINKSEDMDDGLKLVNLLNAVEFYGRTIPDDSPINEAAIKKLKDVIILRILFIRDKTCNSWWKKGNELQKVVDQMLLDNYYEQEFDVE
jgi:hypothetical protein